MMRATAARTTLAGALALGVAVAGCGQTGEHRPSLRVGAIPLVGGARVAASARSCDTGANAYCALQLVVVGPRYRSTTELLASEAARLRALGWTSTVGDTPQQRSADSPSHRFRLSYARAFDDLLSWDRGQIKRRPQVARALARTMFERLPALSIMLQTGSS